MRRRRGRGLVLEEGGRARVDEKRSFVDARPASPHSMLRSVENSRRKSTTNKSAGPVFSTPCFSDTVDRWSNDSARLRTSQAGALVTAAGPDRQAPRAFRD